MTLRTVLAAAALALTTALAGFGADAFRIVTPQWVAAQANAPNVRILDVRAEPHLYFASHVPNAVNMADNTLRGPSVGVPVQYPPSAMLGELLARAGVRDGDTVVVYSDRGDVLGATMTAYVLKKIGHPNTAILDGGWSGYVAAGQPTTQQYPTYTPGPLTVTVDPTVSASLADVQAAIGNPRIKLIDARPPAAYAGNVTTWQRNGHIPGAINIDWHTFVDPNNPHQFKSAADMQAVFNAKGIQKTDDVILYCGTSREASLEFMTMRDILGYPNVRLYEGSWTEYSAHPELPVATGPNPM
jgi:thiosulfate/3-mercaptopyruvate sulfurtransferase